MYLSSRDGDMDVAGLVIGRASEERSGSVLRFASTLTLSQFHVISRKTSTVPKERFHGAKRNEVSTYLRIYLLVNYTFPSLHETTCL